MKLLVATSEEGYARCNIRNKKKRLMQKRNITCCNSKHKASATELAGTLAIAVPLRSRGGGLRSRGGGGGEGLRSREGPIYLVGAAAVVLISSGGREGGSEGGRDGGSAGGGTAAS